MTSVLVVSDTHGDLDFVRRVLAAHPEVTEVLHLGDHCDDAVRLSDRTSARVRVVRGNGDFTCRHGCLLEETVTIGGIRLVMCHGHRYDVKTGLSRLSSRFLAADPPVDGVLFGHTHRAFLQRLTRPDGGLLVMLNPGSARGTVRSGGPSPSLAVLRLEAGKGAAGIAVEWVGEAPSAQ